MIALSRNQTLRGWFEKFSPILVRHFRKRGMGAEAEDLTQEVFIKLQAIIDGGSIENIDGYIFRIANSVLVDRVRSARSRGGLHGQIPADFDDETQVSPETSLMAREEWVRFVSCLEALPTRTREAFYLHRFEGMNYLQIAKHMSISVSAVDKLIGRAIAKLAIDLA